VEITIATLLVIPLIAVLLVLRHRTSRQRTEALRAKAASMNFTFSPQGDATLRRTQYLGTRRQGAERSTL
jgi:hypothetical protein